MITPTGRVDRELASDCARCTGLCCTALQFSAGAEFARSKGIGDVCINQGDEGWCTIHDRLRDTGWRGCTTYECFGAGQRLTETVGPWQDSAHPGRIFAAFSALHSLHELLFLLQHAPKVDELEPQQRELVALVRNECTRVEASATDRVDTGERWAPIGALRSRIGAWMVELSNAVRGYEPGAELAYRDLAGQDLRTRDLRRAGLRGAVLIQADLRGSDLSGADLLGADLRDADLRGARTEHALFLTQPQLNAASGDATTTTPQWFVRPSHWG